MQIGASLFIKIMKTHRRHSRASSILFQVRIATAGMLLILAATTFSVAVRGAGKGASGVTQRTADADAFNEGPTVDASSVIVQLKGDPLSTYGVTKPAPGKKID